jgi:hypothetical protein
MDSLTTGLLGTMLAVWGILTLLWVVLLGYRAVLVSREEDQMFLVKGEAGQAADQRVLVSKLVRLSKPIWILGILSVGMILVIICMWLWQGMHVNP